MDLLLTPASNALGKLLRLPLRLIPKNAVFTVRRGINEGMKWRVGSSIHGCWLGTYEPLKQASVRTLVRPGMNILDIGANAGFYTLGFARLCGPGGRVWAFEPLAINAANLLDHVRLNRLDNVVVMQCAVSDVAGMTGFRRASHNSMGALHERESAYLVPAVRLDDLDIPPIDVVKVDVEGGELAVLHGATGLLARRRATWLIALDAPQDRHACRDLLRASGYRVEDLGSPNEIVAIPDR